MNESMAPLNVETAVIRSGPFSTNLLDRRRPHLTWFSYCAVPRAPRTYSLRSSSLGAGRCIQLARVALRSSPAIVLLLHARIVRHESALLIGIGTSFQATSRQWVRPVRKRNQSHQLSIY